MKGDKMCKYCEPKNPGAILEICEDITKYARIYKVGRRYRLDTSIVINEKQIKGNIFSIKYCPKCGRKLS